MDIRRPPESQNQNDSNDEQDTDKDTDKVAIEDTVKNAVVSSVFVRLRTIFGEQYLSDPSVVEGGIRPIRRH